jgi:hypothetical protein
MRRNGPRTQAALLSAALVVSVVGVSMTVANAAPTDPTGTATTLLPTNDATVSRESPRSTAGSRHLLVVRKTSRHHKKAYLKFVVPQALLGDDGRIESAVLTMKSPSGSGSTVSVRATSNTAWSEASLDYANAPLGKATIAPLVRHSGGVSSADLRSAVTGAGTYTFALTTSSGRTRFYSSESARNAPRLTVTVRHHKQTAPAPTPAPPTPPAAEASKTLLGMSAPDNLWAQRVSEVGPGLQARRLFFTSFTASIDKAQTACNDGMYPVMSFKTGGYSWAQVAAGNADADLRALNVRLTALSCDVFVAVHHEPDGDGAAADWAAMQVHALPILGVGADVKVGVIGNGWWWSAANQGYTDAEIATFITPAVIAVSDVIGADTYQMTASGEEAAPKILRMSAWARRVGGVKALGIGEFNAPSAAAITNATNAIAADPLFAWGCVWNADLKTVTVLSGDRLTAFQQALANW